MNIALESPDQPEVRALIDELDRYGLSLYPPESCYRLDIAALLRPEVRFAVARDAQGHAVGCAALVLHADFGEVKRMFVRPAQRGAGVGRALLGCVEAQAVQGGCAVLRLETGVLQPEALALYARAGFERRGRFADYADDPLSVFMEKRLAL